MPAHFAPLAMPAPISRWWATKSRAERRLIAALALVLAIAALWALVWRPITRDTSALRAAAPAERAALVQAERMVGEIAGLSRSAPAKAANDPRAEIERALAERGVAGPAAAIDWRDGRARVALEAARFDALAGALEALQRDAKLRIVEATLTARVEPGTVRAEIVLAR
jgi:type II secretory pathway component PulM